jgi:hypothetical protein
MEKDQYGVWEIAVPPKAGGEVAIPHNSQIKVSFNGKMSKRNKYRIFPLDIPYLEPCSYRAYPGMDQVRHTRSPQVAHIRSTLLEPTQGGTLRVQAQTSVNSQ